MNASFEEKSVWIQLLSMLLVLGGYFLVAGLMLSNGVRQVLPFVPLFIAAVVLMVIVMALGYAVVALGRGSEARDERDRLIEWRAESNSAWLLGAGVLTAATGLILAVDRVWIIHLLLLSLFLSHVLCYVLQLFYYRRGM